MLRIRIVVADADDDRAEVTVVASRRRQHRRRQRVALGIAQREEQRHYPLHVRIEADILLDEAARRRLVGLGRLFALLRKKLLDRMAHDVGFDGGFGLRLDAEPALFAWGVANIFHASSTISSKQAGTANGTRQASRFPR